MRLVSETHAHGSPSALRVRQPSGVLDALGAGIWPVVGGTAGGAPSGVPGEPVVGGAGVVGVVGPPGGALSGVRGSGVVTGGGFCGGGDCCEKRKSHEEIS